MNIMNAKVCQKVHGAACVLMHVTLVALAVPGRNCCRACAWGGGARSNLVAGCWPKLPPDARLTRNKPRQSCRLTLSI